VTLHVTFRSGNITHLKIDLKCLLNNSVLHKLQVTLVVTTRLTLDCIYLGIVCGSVQDSLLKTIAELTRPYINMYNIVKHEHSFPIIL
jgi:hypothetical protein